MSDCEPPCSAAPVRLDALMLARLWKEPTLKRSSSAYYAHQCQNGRVTTQKSKCLLCYDRGSLQWKHPATAKVGCPRCRRTAPKRAVSTARVEQILDELLADERTGGR